MKANDLPEKIYIHPDNVVMSEVLSHKIEGDVEYIRTDAFIEQAIKWIRESVTNNPERNRIISKKGVITMGGLIEDFKNYMK